MTKYKKQNTFICSSILKIHKINVTKQVHHYAFCIKNKKTKTKNRENIKNSIPKETIIIRHPRYVEWKNNFAIGEMVEQHEKIHIYEKAKQKEITNYANKYILFAELIKKIRTNI